MTTLRTNRMTAACWWVAMCFVVAVGWSHAARATEAEPPGKALYLKYCSACHGEGGKGDGVVSGFLRPKPSDLTQLAKKADGKFSFLQTMQAIDGTTTLRAHGDPMMPVWGESFRADAHDSMSQQVRVKGKLMLITSYLEAIQEK